MGEPVTRLSELDPDQVGNCFVLLDLREKSLTRDGKPYYRVVLRDLVRTVTAMIWSDSDWFDACGEWQPGRFYKLRGRYYETQYGPQIDLLKIRPVVPADAADGFEPREFFKSTRFDVDAMFEELLQIIEREISEPALRQLTRELLLDHAETIKTMAAAARNHHAYQGGFVEHVLSVTKTAVYLAQKYSELYPHQRPPLSKSLVVAGAVLHDIGKLEELNHLPQGAHYTAAGRLIGHILLGRDLVRAKAAQIEGLDPELLLRLEHMIVAHQNRPEWGSPVAPHTPEALLVHYADEIDAKYHMLAAALEGAPGSEDEFTGTDNPLRRPFFRGLAQPPTDDPPGERGA